ncbi:YcaO-like family protein [Achromobacter spanius]|uniref:YcaO-like family protein n=1 Tax=Achromobacter spanius TaxID=217203 RepID=UPI0032095BAA
MTLPGLLSRHLLDRAAGTRCGLVLPAQGVEPQACDALGPLLDGLALANAAVPGDPVNAWQTVSGAVGVDEDAARQGAIAEALERLAAARVELPLRARASLDPAQRLDEDAFALFSPAQRGADGFPWPMARHDTDLFAPVHHLGDNRERWVPQELVGLGPRAGDARLPSTSSGLAAWRDAAEGPWLAVLRAAQEVLERDALAVTWLNGLGGRRLDAPADWHAYAVERGGELAVFDLTQAWNPHPVIAVAGGLPYQGRPRHVLGIACRATAGAALHKALMEWAQSLAFAAHLANRQAGSLPRDPDRLRRFDEHAVFYTLRPELWRQIALLAHAQRTGRAAPVPVPDEGIASPAAAVHAVVDALGANGIDLYYRELTTVDVAACGLRVVRVLSPQLSGLHADERAPFLGGRCGDVAWRYPGSTRRTAFPNPLPHPLG